MTDRSLIEEAGIGVSSAARILDEALAGAEDGEIYVESVRSESFLFDDGRLKSASYDSGQGFGLRRFGRNHRLRSRQRDFRGIAQTRRHIRGRRQARAFEQPRHGTDAGESSPLCGRRPHRLP
jgi:predicted Zn-dependent protease